MGTKMHCKSYFSGLYSMRDLNDDSCSSSWPVFYGDKMVANGPYYNGFMPKALGDGYSGHEKNTLKQKMLEHEAVFKNQVLELHRLYRIQRDMMEEFKRKDRSSMEQASLLGLQGEEARKWHMAGFPFSNSSYCRTSVGGIENFSSPTSCTKGNITQPGQLPFQNGSATKNYEASESRPLKVRKKLFDLQLPADEYVDPEEDGNSQGYKKDASSHPCNGDATNGPENGVKFFLGSNAGAKNDCLNDASASAACLRSSIGLADLNEPIQIEETTENGETKNTNWLAKSMDTYLSNARGWLSHVNGSGCSRGNISAATQNCQPNKSPLSSHFPPAMYSSGYNREEKSREGFQHGPESSDRCRSNLPFFTSSSSVTSWLHSASSWPPPSCSNPVAVTCSPAQPSKLNRGFGSEPKSNGFVSFSKGAIDINLNEELPKSVVNEKVILQDLNIADAKSKPENEVPSLPWLKPKPVHIDEVTDTRKAELSRELSHLHASSNGSFSKNDAVGDLNQLYPSKSIPREKEIVQTLTVKKILGFPIFERAATENGANFCSDERKKGMIDINVACEPDEEATAEKGNEENVTPIKDQFDLNSCVSEYEEPSPPFFNQNGAGVKMSLEIDLEVPILMESDDDSRESKAKILYDNQNEIFRDAAETLLAISSCQQVYSENIIDLPSEASVGEALLWFAEAISSDPNEALTTSQQMDDFEATTLQLVKTKPEDYMPKPFLPELLKLEARPLQTRTRRGHSRRGRQWRDFQRDILPGLASLSRLEMTEDLQIFGGMMRATGHSWNSGPTRRNCSKNGGGRGRRRAVVEAVLPPLMEQLSSIEAGLVDRSFTGWGKTTRRPRRQRCPAGNPPTVVLT